MGVAGVGVGVGGLVSNGPFSSGGQTSALTGVIHGNRHVIVLSCTHLQKNVCLHVISLFLVLTFDPTGKGSINFAFT